VLEVYGRGAIRADKQGNGFVEPTVEGEWTMLNQEYILNPHCLPTFYNFQTCVFFLSAYIAWLSAISYHIQKVFRTVKCGEHRHQFLVYSAFVWTTAATVTGVFYLIQNTRYECQKESKFAGRFFFKKLIENGDETALNFLLYFKA